MKRIIPLIMILILSGCITSSVCGVYRLDGATLALRDDNSYLYTTDSGTSFSGHTEMYKDKIELTNSLGMTTILTITKDGLVDDEGKLWRKK
jgi:hypothetical protein